MAPVSEQIEVDLESLIRRHQADIWRYLGATASDADDLTQETFLALGKATFEVRTDRETTAYLRKVARNQLLVMRRRAGRAIGTVDLTAADQVWADMVEPGGTEGLLAALTER